MCGIGYIRSYTKEHFLGIIKDQLDRGTDSIGYIDKDQFYAITTDKLTENSFIEEVEKISSYVKDDSPIVFHTRKASVGAKNIKNVHPIDVGPFWIIQNGTERKFSERAKIHLLSKYDDSRNDTYYIGKYLEAHHLEGIDLYDTLIEFKNSDLTFGNIFIIPKNKKTLMFMSDGTRDSYVHLDEKGHVQEISNYGYSKNKDVEDIYSIKLPKTKVVMEINFTTGKIIRQSELITTGTEDRYKKPLPILNNSYNSNYNNRNRNNTGFFHKTKVRNQTGSLSVYTHTKLCEAYLEGRIDSKIITSILNEYKYDKYEKCTYSLQWLGVLLNMGSENAYHVSSEFDSLLGYTALMNEILDEGVFITINTVESCLSGALRIDQNEEDSTIILEDDHTFG